MLRSLLPEFNGGLPLNVLNCFMSGELVMWHILGFWNAMWKNMCIESTFMEERHNTLSHYLIACSVIACLFLSV